MRKMHDHEEDDAEHEGRGRSHRGRRNGKEGDEENKSGESESLTTTLLLLLLSRDLQPAAVGLPSSSSRTSVILFTLYFLSSFHA
jgi:hypothetical protein